MKVVKYQGSDEKMILTSMIVHDHVLDQIHQEVGSRPEGPFKNRWANLISEWCFSYWKRQKKAPRKIIRHYFEKWAGKEEDENSIRLVEKFLASLSGEYSRLEKEINPLWILERAGEHFEKVRLEKMAEAVESALENGDVELAKKAHAECEPISFSPDSWMNPFSKREIHAAIERRDQTQPLIRFGGDLGKFLDEAFERDAFLAFQAPEKKGKSFWLQEVVWRSIRQRRRVLYYVLGDMSKDQVKRRFYARMARKPWKNKNITYALPRKIRKTGEKDEAGHPIVEISAGEEKEFTPYHYIDVIRAVKRLRMNTALKENPLRIKCKGAGLVSASDVEADLKKLHREGFIPDIVVIDYSDLLAPEPGTGKLDIRHQMDATWKVLRRISTENHILMVTATQAASRSYNRWLMSKGDFSEDKRKNAHVTGMLGLNQTPEEKKRGLYRLNWIFLRDGEWSETQYVWTVGNLGLGCPCFKSLI